MYFAWRLSAVVCTYLYRRGLLPNMHCAVWKLSKSLWWKLNNWAKYPLRKTPLPNFHCPIWNCAKRRCGTVLEPSKDYWKFVEFAEFFQRGWVQKKWKTYVHKLHNPALNSSDGGTLPDTRLKKLERISCYVCNQSGSKNANIFWQCFCRQFESWAEFSSSSSLLSTFL